MKAVITITLEQDEEVVIEAATRIQDSFINATINFLALISGPSAKWDMRDERGREIHI